MEASLHKFSQPVVRELPRHPSASGYDAGFETHAFGHATTPSVPEQPVPERRGSERPFTRKLPVGKTAVNHQAELHTAA